MCKSNTVQYEVFFLVFVVVVVVVVVVAFFGRTFKDYLDVH